MKNYLLICSILLASCTVRNDVDNSNSAFGYDTPGNIPQVFGADIVSVAGRFELGLTISSDGSSIAFGVAEPDKPEQTCIYLMYSAEGKWTSPDKSFLPGNMNTYFPMFGPHGDRLFFARSTAESDTEIWVADYRDQKALAPIPLAPGINSPYREAGHGNAKDSSFYFTSNRDQQNPCCGDIYAGRLQTEGEASVRKVSELSSAADEESLFLSPDGDYIIIQAWKDEFKTKHDLYVSYRKKDRSWSLPQRLNEQINSPEIEQRPFVSPDNDYLFFSRMSVSRENAEPSYESDIYWVSTESVFGPYPYDTQVATSIREGEPFEVNFSSELFKDVDDDIMTYMASLEDGSPLPHWIVFDSEALSLSGTWKSGTSLRVQITATDTSGNAGVFILDLAG